MNSTSKKPQIELTTEEISDLKKAFKDEEFRKLFREYAEELSKTPQSERDIEINKLKPDSHKMV